MPKKTRREKIIAELRRKLAVTKKAGQEIGIEKLEIPKTSHLPPQDPAFPVSLPTTYLKRDLTKTFTLAILAISLELVLYFWLG